MYLRVETSTGKDIYFPIKDKDFFSYDEKNNTILINRIFPYNKEKILLSNITLYEVTSDTGSIIMSKKCTEPENVKPSIVDINFI